MITFVAVPYQMFRLTHSSLQVGLLGLAEFAPLLPDLGRYDNHRVDERSGLGPAPAA